MGIIRHFSVIFLLCQTASAAYTITIHQRHFDNPDHVKRDGSKCDSWLVGTKCDLYFKVCVDFKDGRSWDDGQCRIKGPYTLALRTTNSISVAHPWQGGVLLKVTAWDRDPGDDDIVDKMSGVLNLQASRSASVAALKYFTIYGGHTYMNVKIKVYCDRNWYGSDCNTYCSPSGSDHYSCSADGSKDCDNNYHGTDCNVYCSSSYNYYCSSAGTKVCRDDYYGADCGTHCMETDRSHCSLTGTKVCNNGYYGANCDKYCLGSSRFSCTSDGTKVCHNDYYGEDCDQYCRATDAYYCKSDGTKVCHNDYYGESCDIYCKEQNDEGIGYTCAGNGSKICIKDWCSMHCNVSCAMTETGQGIGWKVWTIIIIIGSVVGVVLCVGVAWKLSKDRQNTTALVAWPQSDRESNHIFRSGPDDESYAYIVPGSQNK